MNPELQEAIALANAGRKKQARRLLLRVVSTEPQNTVAWLWLESTLDKLDERRECLEIVLKIQPDNVVARKRLKLLLPTHKKKQSLILTIVSYLLWLLLCVGLVSPLRNFFRPSLPSPPSRHYTVPNSPSQFHLLWTMENIYYRGWGSNSIGLVVKSSEVFLLGGIDPNLSSITKFDLNTGEIVQVISSFSGVHSLAIDDKLLMGGINGSRNTQAQIVAYDIESGEQVYLHNFGLAQSIRPVNVTDSSVRITFSNPSSPYQELLFRHGDLSYYRINPGDRGGVACCKLAAWNYRTQGFVWERDWSNEADFDYLPYLANDVILGRNFALDSQTGRELWRLTDVDDRVSNVSVSNGIAYYLTRNGELRALNVRTGKLLASLQFEVEVLTNELASVSTGSNSFNVASSAGKVIVYLGDAYQLFVFQFTP